MKRIVMTVLVLIISFTPSNHLHAQGSIIDIVKAGIIKVIKAVDLKIQRLQNKTLWLQNAQKVLENKMSELKLTEITGWVDKQKALYTDYFDELWKIKSAISTYQRVRDIIKKQVQLVSEYSRAMPLFKQDRHFTEKEIKIMQEVYDGILNESVKNIEQVQLVLNAFVTQMTDAKRLEIIKTASDNIEQNISDLRHFNQENIKVRLQRAKDKNDINAVRKLYGL
jgi:hypothetical protein